MRLLSPPCPVCAKPVPFARTQWGLGKAFVCDGCGTRIVIPRNYWIGLGAFLVFWNFKDRMDTALEVGVLIGGLAAMVILLSRLLVVPRKA